jgi:serine/threonine protein phosphatase PrpC
MRNVEKIRFFGDTDAGKRRTNNEDAFVAEKLDGNIVLAIVIDGVGGYEGGEVAAEIAQNKIPDYLKEFNRGERLELLKQAVVCANNAIFDRRHLDTERPNMGCVLTSVIIDDSRKVIDMVHVGDTRLYQFNKGELIKLSHDHSFVGYCEEIGDLTEEQAMRHPRRNEISRSVGEERHGVNDQSFLDAEEFPLLPNSTFLLCSDGLTDMITSKQIVAILERDLSLEEKAQALIDAANEAGGKDNITVVLVEYRAEEETELGLIQEDPVQTAEESNNENLSAKQDTKKRWFSNMLLPFLLVIDVLLLGACILLGVLSLKISNRVQSLEQQMTQITPYTLLSNSVISLPNDTINVLKEKINNYIQAAQNNNSDLLLQMYADTVRRYINYSNIKKERVVDLYSRFDKKRNAVGKTIKVRWDTWVAKQLPNSEISVDFVEDFKVVKRDSTEVSYVVHCFVTFDRDGKIVSVLEDLLQKARK